MMAFWMSPEEAAEFKKYIAAWEEENRSNPEVALVNEVLRVHMPDTDDVPDEVFTDLIEGRDSSFITFCEECGERWPCPTYNAIRPLWDKYDIWTNGVLALRLLGLAHRGETRVASAAGQAGLDAARPERAAVDEARVGLHQGGT
jgi:hypothetical protein